MRAVFLLSLLPAFACGLFLSWPEVPVDRLKTNVKAHSAESGNPAEAQYLLGRLDSLAFSERVRSQKTAGPPRSTKVMPTKIRDLFFSSIEHYRQAIALSPESALYHFSLGWMADEALVFYPQLRSPPTNLIANDRTMTWRLLAIREYREAYRLSNVKVDYVGPGDVLAAQSGRALIADLSTEVAERKARPGAGADAAFITEAERTITAVRANVDHLNSLPRSITPLIFSMRPGVHLADLLSQKTVLFDLDGFAESRSWPWLRSDTALLVWDPRREGHILSGLQLFGSVTWWMFWKNGFEPLAALDDNADGWLTGKELDGIGIWMDRDCNGISDAGEVIPADEFGVVAISTHSQGEVDGVAANPSGVRMRDGRVLTLFDWVPHSSAPAYSLTSRNDLPA